MSVKKMLSQSEVLMATARQMREAVLSEHVRGTAKVGYWLAYHTHRSDHSAAGYLDWHFLKPDGSDEFWVELKRQSEEPTPAQWDWIRALRIRGYEVNVWKPMDWLDGTIERRLLRRQGRIT